MKKITLLCFAFLTSVAINAQCTVYVDGPYTNFNTLGGAPGQGDAPIEIVTFEIWKSEAYLMDGIVAGNTYKFSACNGPGAGSWLIDFAIGPNDGANQLASVDAFGTDVDSVCSLTFTATTSGSYLIVINELDNCGVAEAIDNGFPKIEFLDPLSVGDQEFSGFSYLYNATTKQLVLSANEVISNISMFNLLGQQVVSKNLSNTNELIDMSSLKDGIYIGSVTINGKNATFKIAKR